MIYEGNYSLWHCRVLYTLSQSNLKKISQLTGWSVSKLSLHCSSEQWDYRREKFHKELNSGSGKAEDYDFLELLLGDFLAVSEKVKFVKGVLSHCLQAFVPEVPPQPRLEGNPLDAIAHRLTEHGFDLRQARELIASAIDPTKRDVTDFLDKKEQNIDLLADIDNKRLGYAAVASQYDEGITETLDTCRIGINLFRRELDRVILALPHNYTAEDLLVETAGQGVKWMNYISQAIARLAELQLKASGASRYIDHDANVAKLVKNGYMVVETDAIDKFRQQRANIASGNSDE